MRQSLAIAFAALSLAGASPSLAFTFDGGGDVLHYMNNVHVANARRQEMRLDGTCLSACTMKLGIRRACVTPDARFGFHSPVRSDGSLAAGWRAVLLGHYPERVRRYVEPMLADRDYTMVSGATLIALGMRACNDGPAREDYALRSAPAQPARVTAAIAAQARNASADTAARESWPTPFWSGTTFPAQTLAARSFPAQSAPAPTWSAGTWPAQPARAARPAFAPAQAAPAQAWPGQIMHTFRDA